MSSSSSATRRWPGPAPLRCLIWEPEETFRGPEDTWLGDERYSGDRQLAQPLGASQMGLIYANPEDPTASRTP